MLNLNKHTKINLNLTNTHLYELLLCTCISLCTSAVHNTAQNSSDDFLSYHPVNCHSSDDVFWRREAGIELKKSTEDISSRKL